MDQFLVSLDEGTEVRTVERGAVKVPVEGNQSRSTTHKR